jgi:catechol 2,3-dioxygenase-like lactoylglutathione lyase family enzyme
MTLIDRLVPMAFVADVARSIEFYGRLGFAVANTVEHGGRLSWAMLTSGGASLMVSIASGPVDASVQAVLFYLYTNDIVATHAALGERGVKVGELTRPFYMPKGEVRVEDPDGYVLLIGQV